VKETYLYTQRFWNTNQSKFPNISLVAHKMLSSSASIERVFSICGVICTQRRGNMYLDTVLSFAILF